VPTVLIVDDHRAVRRAIRAGFTNYAEFKVCGEAVDGVDAIEKAARLRPDFILLDLAMPRMGGKEAAPILKGLLPQVRIVAFSLNAEYLSESTASKAGFDGVVEKPDGIEKVVECFQSLRETV